MVNNNIVLGQIGEKLAAEFLKKNGYKIFEINYRCRLGQLDIVAKDKETICFVEVKTRSSLNMGLPQEAISSFKQHKISKVALVYLKSYNLIKNRARFDIVSVILKDNAVNKIELIKDAFPLDARYTY
jgi:putative endonuclease